MNVIKNVFKSTLVVAILGVSSLQAQDLSQVKNWIAQQQYNKAKAALKDLIASEPSVGENYYFLGDVYLHQGMVDSAKSSFDKGIDLKDNGYLNYIGLGQIDLANKDTNAAALNFAKASSKIKSRDYNQRLLIAKAYLNADPAQTSEVFDIAKKILEQDPYNVEAYLVLGEVNALAGNNQESFNSYRQAAMLQGENSQAKLALALVTKKMRGYSASVTEIKEIIEAEPDFLPGYTALGQTYYQWSLHDKAKSAELQKKAKVAYENYFDKGGADFKQEIDYVTFLLDTNQGGQAISFIAQLQKKYPQDVSVAQLLPLAYYQAKDYQDAIVEFEKLVKNYPDVDSQVYFYLGSSYLLKSNASQSDYNKALDYLKTAMLKDSSVSTEFNSLGVELFRQKKYEWAISVFKVAIEDKQGDNYPADLYYIGYCSFLQAEDAPTEQQVALVDQANEYFDKCISTGKYLVEANFYKARANRLLSSEPKYYDLVFQGYDGFLQQMKKSTQELDKTDTERLVEAYNWLGSYYANQGDHFKAKECFNITLSLDQSNSYALKTLKALDGM